jgi:hypothetical protein
MGYLTNNALSCFNEQKQFTNFLEMDFDITTRITIDDEISRGEWTDTNEYIHLKMNGNTFSFRSADAKIQIGDSDFYKILNDELLSIFILCWSNAVNYAQAKKMIDNQMLVNSAGFGQGTVYKNFDYTNPIILD